jgi:hypothetical protein
MNRDPGTVGFFHVALMGGYTGLCIANEMHGRILQSGLYDISKEIRVCILGPEDQTDHLMQYVFLPYPKYKVFHISQDFGLYEWPTLQAIKEHFLFNTREEDVWYMHTKGASNTRKDVPAHIRFNIADWRSVMFENMISDIPMIKGILRKTDGAVGPLLRKEETNVPFFAGNFWWATANHIRRLPTPTAYDVLNRMYAETWISAHNEGTLTSLIDGPVLDPYGFYSKDTEERVFKK